MKEIKQERLLHKSRGNYRENSSNPLNWTGGNWLLFKDKIVFKSNLSNLIDIKKEVNLKEIVSIESNHLDFISSKITIFLANGSIIELHVPQRRYWIDKIKNLTKNTVQNQDRDRNNKEIQRIKSKKIIQVFAFEGSIRSWHTISCINYCNVYSY
jgi:hypothetical protein